MRPLSFGDDKCPRENRVARVMSPRNRFGGKKHDEALANPGRHAAAGRLVEPTRPQSYGKETPSGRSEPNASAFALATISRSPYDVRPHLLDLLHWQRTDRLSEILAHFEACIEHWCLRTDHPASLDTQRTAVREALRTIALPDDCMDTAAAAKEARTRKSTYLTIHNAALSMIRNRLGEASGDYMSCLLGTGKHYRSVEFRYRARKLSDRAVRVPSFTRWMQATARRRGNRPALAG
jgi:hypothetical protein